MEHNEYPTKHPRGSSPHAGTEQHYHGSTTRRPSIKPIPENVEHENKNTTSESGLYHTEE